MYPRSSAPVWHSSITLNYILSIAVVPDCILETSLITPLFLKFLTDMTKHFSLWDISFRDPLSSFREPLLIPWQLASQPEYDFFGGSREPFDNLLSSSKKIPEISSETQKYKSRASRLPAVVFRRGRVRPSGRLFAQRRSNQAGCFQQATKSVSL